MKTTRRSFLLQTGAAGLYSFGGLPPRFLLQAAEQSNTSNADRILVLIQLAGGNDGLNTVIPFADDAYYRARPGIAVGRESVLRLNDDLGLHPSLVGLKQLFDAGHLRIVQGVGYPHPDRSHFRSMDIWQTASTQPSPGQDGWLGRALSTGSTGIDSTVPAMTIGLQYSPWALQSSRVPVASIRNPEDYRWVTGLQPHSADRHYRELARRLTHGSTASENPELDFVRAVSQTAYATAERLESIADAQQSQVTYPTNQLGKRLRHVARFITADLGVRVFFLSLDGFDTHAQQQNSHAALLNELSTAVSAFLQDLDASHLSSRVCVCTFSEFGRRVSENGSLGTDHGAASQMFLISPEQGGITGEHPSLTELDDGDLRHHTDFRQVYAALLEQWLGIPSAEVLGPGFPALSLFGV